MHLDLGFLCNLATCPTENFTEACSCTSEDQKRHFIELLLNANLFTVDIKAEAKKTIFRIISNCARDPSKFFKEFTSGDRIPLIQSIIAAILKEIYTCEVIGILSNNGEGYEDN